MAFTYSVFDTTPANLVADLKAKILLSSDWSNPSGNVVKATTPLGAVMAIDLAGTAAPTNVGWVGPSFYRTYATSSGTDRLDNYGLFWKGASSGTTTTVPLHVTLIAGNTLLWIQIEGPRAGENFADTTPGSFRQTLALSQLTPYFAADTTPQVVLIGSSQHNIGGGGQGLTYAATYVRVSQNVALTSPWVTGHLMGLTFPQDTDRWSTVMPNRGNDGSFYLSPYVLFEHQTGIRGRLTDIYFGGVNRSLNNADLFVQAHTVGDILTIGGNTYVVTAPYRGTGSNTWNAGGGFGYYVNSGLSDWARSPLVAVRTA